jgi:cyanate lyase
LGRDRQCRGVERSFRNLRLPWHEQSLARNGEKVAALLGLPDEAAVVLAEYPTKSFAQTVPTDPCIYRWYEITGVFGEAFKELVQEKCGDGIMSAIDFDMDIEKVPHEKGDRIKVTMSGKFLPYKSW